jgi:hypothetical protein
MANRLVRGGKNICPVCQSDNVWYQHPDFVISKTVIRKFDTCYDCGARIPRDGERRVTYTLTSVYDNLKRINHPNFGDVEQELDLATRSEFC